jgi:D-alanyl-D-alanine carboxypeptidase (penicillin-binding protein 5/6)
MRVLVRLLVAAVVLAAPGAASAADCPDTVSAPAAVVIDARTSDVLCERRADDRRAIASTTKLMTALVVLEKAKLSDVVTATAYRGLAVESKLGLRAGERMTVADLLRGLLIVSANDAAATLAEHVSGSREAFVRDMNRRAAEFGLRGTRFANPIGLDAPGNHSTARELAKLTQKLREFRFFRQVVNTTQTTLKTGVRPRTISNRNLLVQRVKEVNGVKTGKTQGAGWVLVGSATRRKITLITVVLGAGSERARQDDTTRLLTYGYRRYRSTVAVRRGQVFRKVPIRFRPGAELHLMASRTVRPRILRGTGGFKRELLDVPAEVEGPIRRGQRMGTIEIFHRGERISRVPLVSSADVAAAGPARRAQEYLTRPRTLGLIGLVLLAGVIITGLRRRSGARAKARTDSRGVPAG